MFWRHTKCLCCVRGFTCLEMLNDGKTRSEKWRQVGSMEGVCIYIFHIASIMTVLCMYLEGCCCRSSHLALFVMLGRQAH